MDEQKENHSVEEKQEELEERVENELISALNRKDKDAVLKLVEDSHPIDLAYALEEASDSDIVFLATILPDQQMAEIIEQADDELQVRIMKLFDLNKILNIFQHMSKDDIVDILGDMPANRRKELVKLMKSSDQEVIRNLLGYGESTAGGIMTTEYISMRNSHTVSQALEKVKEIAPKTEELNILYVLNEKKQLVGTVSLRELLVAKNYDTLNDIMEDNVISVEPEADQEDVARLVSKYDLHAIPVVNKRKGMLGIITVDDVMEGMEEEATEDFEKMAAMLPSEKPYLKTGVFTLAKNRIPWLLILMLSSTITGGILVKYENAFAAIPLLVSFIPMLMDTGGNSGSQSSTMIIRGMAIGDVEPSDILKVVWKEVRVGVIVGFVLAVVNFIRLMIQYPGNTMICVTVVISLFCTVIVAKTIGCTLPIGAKVLKLDPAIMASPMITTIVDAVSLMVYFNLACHLLDMTV